jgi:LysR family glycine cleavage system transcriptional activator
MEIDIAHVDREAAARGQGVALADSFSARDDLADDMLVRPFRITVAAKHAYYPRAGMN